jgi:hypothetical protein
MSLKRICLIVFLLAAFLAGARAQDDSDATPVISGELTSDARFLLKDSHDWVWNENRLALKISKKITGKTRFSSELWIRNIGLPDIAASSDLYNKGITDPLNVEIREAALEVYGFLLKDLDVRIGRQIISWGTADKINPTSNLNPADMEDILDFGRLRGTEAVNAVYYFSRDLSLQGVFIPFFRPANLPVGAFAGAMTPAAVLPAPMTLSEYNDTIIMPRYNLVESTTAGLRLKGYFMGTDLSVSYVWGYDGLPVADLNILRPADMTGGVSLDSRLYFNRTHVIGADFSGSLGGAGLWGEVAVFIPDRKAVMTTDLTALYPMSPVPVTVDSVISDRPYVRFIAGGDYSFSNGSYLNIQYLHGFYHERGSAGLNDYIFMRYEMKCFGEKLKFAPLSGAIIINDWKKIKDNITVAYLPQLTLKVTDDAEITFAAALFEGKGKSLFSAFNDFDMAMVNLRYSF